MMPQLNSLGKAWVDLVERTVQEGKDFSNEGRELRNVVVSFPSDCEADPLIELCGDARMVAQMRSVFFDESANDLGHNYFKGMRGPDGRNDLKDVIALLRQDPWSKRAAVTFCGQADGKVPCVNVIHFLERNGRVEASYFARGQDVFRKFYADGLCLAAMARSVAAGLNLPVGQITGFISSSHVYHKDLPEIQDMLAQAKSHFRTCHNGAE